MGQKGPPGPMCQEVSLFLLASQKISGVLLAKIMAGLIAGLIKGKTTVFISPDHKRPRLFLGGVRGTSGGGWLISHEKNLPSCKLTVRWLENPPNFDGIYQDFDGIFMGFCC